MLRAARRDANAAKRFFRRLLTRLQYVSRVIVTDKLRSYGVARRQLIPSIEHRQAENVQHQKAAVEALGLAGNLTITSLYRLLSPPATRRSYESQ
jgi:transposase-like protein